MVKWNKIIASLIKEGETETTEFKENNFNRDEIGKRISALSNSANLLDKKERILFSEFLMIKK